MAKKKIRINEVNRLTGQYTDETHLPYGYFKCVKYSELSEFNAELKPDSPSYGTNQLVAQIDIQPKIDSFSNISIFTYIENLYTSIDLNGGRQYFFNLGDYVLDRISRDYLGYNNIYITCQKSEGEWNNYPNDIYTYRGLAFVFICPHVVFSSDKGLSTVVKLIDLSYEFDINEQLYDREQFTFRKLKTTQTDTSYVLDEINGKKNLSEFTYTEEENTNDTIGGTGYVIYIDNFPFDYKNVNYYMTIKGTLLYQDGTTGDFTHSIKLYF